VLQAGVKPAGVRYGDASGVNKGNTGTILASFRAAATATVTATFQV
jgi:hypothetical protein